MRTFRISSFLISCLVISFLLVSCNQKEPGYRTTDELVCPITLVRFQQDTYKDYILAEQKYDSKDSVEYYALRAPGTVPQELFIGRSPYIPLPDGWYAVDWKWGKIIYRPTNVLLPIVWEKMQDTDQRWDIKIPLLSTNPVTRWSGVRRNAIDKYLNITPTPAVIDSDHREWGDDVSPDYRVPEWAWRYKHLSDVPDTIDVGFTKEDYLRDIARQDSLQEVFIERLTRIIESGDIDEVMYYDYK